MKLEIETNVTIHFYNHNAPNLMQAVIQQGEKIMSALSNLTAQVSAARTVNESAITLLNGLKQKLDEAIASGDPAQIQTLADSLGTDTSALSAAVTANTPADPASGTGGANADGTVNTGGTGA